MSILFAMIFLSIYTVFTQKRNGKLFSKLSVLSVLFIVNFSELFDR